MSRACHQPSLSLPGANCSAEVVIAHGAMRFTLGDLCSYFSRACTLLLMVLGHVVPYLISRCASWPTLRCQSSQTAGGGGSVFYGRGCSWARGHREGFGSEYCFLIERRTCFETTTSLYYCGPGVRSKHQESTVRDVQLFLPILSSCRYSCVVIFPQCHNCRDEIRAEYVNYP